MPSLAGLTNPEDARSRGVDITDAGLQNLPAGAPQAFGSEFLPFQGESGPQVFDRLGNLRSLGCRKTKVTTTMEWVAQFARLSR